VIDTTSTGLSEDTPFQYSRQEPIEEQADETSLQLAELVADYDPESQLVAVFIRPGTETHYEFSMFQMGIGETLLQAIEARGGLCPPESDTSVTPEIPELEPPSLETLIAGESEGGCEAACPQSFWVEPNGTCATVIKVGYWNWV